MRQTIDRGELVVWWLVYGVLFCWVLELCRHELGGLWLLISCAG